MNTRNSFLRGFASALPVLALVAVTTSAHAATLGGDGTFESYTPTQVSGYGGTQSVQHNLGTGTTAGGWSNAGGYDFVFNSTGSAVADSYGNGTIASDSVSIKGISSATGNFLALDADNGYNGVISTSINGLTAGTSYVVSFEFAAGQQTSYACPAGGSSCVDPAVSTITGNVTNAGHSVLGTASFTKQTDSLGNASGWTLETFGFTADATSETLNFFAGGNSTNIPAFALIDGVSVAPAPEPNSLILLGTGLAGLGGLVRSRFSKATAKA